MSGNSVSQHFPVHVIRMITAKLTKIDIAACGTLPANLRLYCVGDIHGRADLLAAMLKCIDLHLARFDIEAAREIHLGDMIDRGPSSKEVIDLLMAPAPARQRILLRGNHEQRLLDLLEFPDGCEQWLYEGGYETMVSYGVPPALLCRPLDGRAVIARLRSEMGAHVEVLRATELAHEAGEFLFVHAGVDPARAIGQQRPADLMGIREPFLSYEGKLARTIVHGHTPASDVQQREHRIGIDTGAFVTDVLTCLILQRESAMVLKVIGQEDGES
jgi:serine/threonine protein phosphatase 1